MKEQASTAATSTHPLFMTPFTPEELKHEIKKLLPDKSPGPFGITNRMLPAGDTDFQGLILIFFQWPMGNSHTTLRLATVSFTTHIQRTQQGQNRPSILQRHISQRHPR